VLEQSRRRELFEALGILATFPLFVRPYALKLLISSCLLRRLQKVPHHPWLSNQFQQLH